MMPPTPHPAQVRHLLPQGEKGRLNALLALREKVPEGRMRGSHT